MLKVNKNGLADEDFGLYMVTYPVSNEFGTYDLKFYVDLFKIGSSVPLDDLSSLESLTELSFYFFAPLL
jgi:hypothetical protein